MQSLTQVWLGLPKATHLHFFGSSLLLPLSQPLGENRKQGWHLPVWIPGPKLRPV
jgi:hypothetical protein